MPRISDADITYVRDHSDIEAVVGEVVQLKRAGGNLKGLCPFHDEKSPSFNVNPARGGYHCFGCGEGGDAIRFVQQMQGQTFVEAVTYLADRLGMKLTPVEGGDTQPAHTGDRNRLLAANKAAAEWFATNLTTEEAQTAVTFLTERGFSHSDAVQFGCGYAPRGWHTTQHHLNSLGFTDTELADAGLVNKGDKGAYDTFRGRLIFPIRSNSGDIIGFGARHLFEDDQGPKYLNTGETLLYKKTNVLYGIDVARTKMRTDNTALIVEGYTDVMACHLAGASNAVATCGTAFGEAHAKMLNRMMGGDGRVVYLFDGDEAGQKAAKKSYELDSVFSHRTYAVLVPDGMDPCDLRQRHGGQAIINLLATPKPLFSLVLEDAIGQVSLNEPETQTSALERAAPILAAITDPALRAEHIRRVAVLTGTQIPTVNSAIAHHGQPRTVSTVPAVNRHTTGEPEPSEKPIDHLDVPPVHPSLATERGTLRFILQKPELREVWAQVVEPADYQHPTYKRLAANLEDPHPVLEQVRRGMLIETISPIHDEDDRPEVLFVTFARDATRRRLSMAASMAPAQMSDSERDTLAEHRARLVTRLNSLHGSTAGSEQ